jgi:uncharacterized protein (TIGR03435 family)
MKPDEANIARLLKKSLPSRQHRELALDRVLQRLQSESTPERETGDQKIFSLAQGADRNIWRVSVAVAAVALVVLASAALIRNVVFPKTAGAMAEVVDGEVVQLSNAAGQPLRRGKPVQPAQVLRSSGRGAVLALGDGSVVEMRSQSELALERADDGVRVRLDKGGVIVNAAKQRSGHLYVETKDAKVSVVGTVFLVDAEEKGSRVAVIEGMVRVEKGALAEKLLPGEQVATNPAVETHPVTQEIAWSRHAEEHLALLQQSLGAPAPALETQDVFEAASIRPSFPGGGGRGGGGRAVDPPTANPCMAPGDITLDPSHFNAVRTTLYGLVSVAYGNNCMPTDMLTGGPDWAKSEHFDLQTTLPAGTPTYTRQALLEGNLPRLQRMLQNLLADRFKLVVRREIKQVPAYDLVVLNEGKLKPSADQNPDAQFSGPLPPARVFTTFAPQYSMGAWAKVLQRILDRPVIDKTGLKGLYDFRLEYSDSSSTPADPSFRRTAKDLLPSVLQEQLGLKVEPARANVEVLVIERAERPGQN